MTDIVLGHRARGRGDDDPLAPLFPHRGRHRLLTIPDDQLRVLHAIGSPGEGKSTAMRAIFRQLVAAGYGGLYIDPQGRDADWLAATLPDAGRIVHIAPGLTRRRYALNVLELDPDDGDPDIWRPIVHGNAVATFGHIGRFDAQTMTNIRTYLNQAVALAQANPDATLIDALLILTHDDYRAHLLAKLNDPYQDLFWAKYAELTDYMRQNQTISTLNRLWEMTQRAVVRDWIAASRSTIPLTRWLCEGRIILVNLRSLLHRDDGEYLGNLLMAAVVNGAQRRADRALTYDDGRPWVIAADEFHRLAPAPFEEIITQARGDRVIPLLANQDRSQLRRVEEIGTAVGHARVELSFSLSREDRAQLGQAEGTRAKAAAIAALKPFQAHAEVRTDRAGTEACVIDIPADPAAEMPGQLARLKRERDDPAGGQTLDPLTIPTLDHWLGQIPHPARPSGRARTWDDKLAAARAALSATKEGDDVAEETTADPTAARTGQTPKTPGQDQSGRDPLGNDGVSVGDDPAAGRGVGAPPPLQDAVGGAGRPPRLQGNRHRRPPI